MNLKKTTLSIAVLLALSFMTGCGGGGTIDSVPKGNFIDPTPDPKPDPTPDPKPEEKTISELTKLKNEVQADVKILSIQNGSNGKYDVTYSLNFKKTTSDVATNALLDTSESTDNTKLTVSINGTENTFILENLIADTNSTKCDKETNLCVITSKLEDVTGADDAQLKVSINNTAIIDSTVEVNREAVATSVIPKPKPNFEINCSNNECFVTNTTQTMALDPVYIWNIKDDGITNVYTSRNPNVVLKNTGTVQLTVIDGFNEGTFKTSEVSFDASSTSKISAIPEITKYVIKFSEAAINGNSVPSSLRPDGSFEKIYGAYYKNFAEHDYNKEICYSYENVPGNPDMGMTTKCPLVDQTDPQYNNEINRDLFSGFEFTPSEMKQKFLDKASIIAVREGNESSAPIYKNSLDNHLSYVLACVDESSPWSVDENGVATLTVTPSAFGNLIVSYANANNYSCEVAKSRLAARLGTTPNKFNYNYDDSKAYIQVLNFIGWIFEDFYPSDAASNLVDLATTSKIKSLFQKVWPNLSYEDEFAIAEIAEALPKITSSYSDAYKAIEEYYAQKGYFKGVKDEITSISSNKAYVNRKMSVYIYNSTNNYLLYTVKNILTIELRPMVYVCNGDATTYNDSSCTSYYVPKTAKIPLFYRIIDGTLSTDGESKYNWYQLTNNYTGAGGTYTDWWLFNSADVSNYGRIKINVWSDLKTKIDEKLNNPGSAKVFFGLQWKNGDWTNVDTDKFDINNSYIIVNNPNSIPNKLTVSKRFNWSTTASNQKTLADIYTQKLVKYAHVSDLSNPISDLDSNGITPSSGEALNVNIDAIGNDSFHVYSILDEYNQKTYLRTSCIPADDTIEPSLWGKAADGSFSYYLKPNTFDFIVSSYAYKNSSSCFDALEEVKNKLSPNSNMENVVFGDKALSVLLTALERTTWELNSTDISTIATLPEKYAGAYDDIKAALEEGLSEIDILNYFKQNNYSFENAKDSQKHAYDNGLISLLGNNSDTECTSSEENGSWKVKCGARIVNNFYSEAEVKVGALIKINGEEIDNQSGLIGVYNDVTSANGNIIVHKVDGRKAYIKTTPKAIVDEAGVAYWSIEMTLKDKPTSFDITLSVEGQGNNSYGKNVTQKTSKQITGEF